MQLHSTEFSIFISYHSCCVLRQQKLYYFITYRLPGMHSTRGKLQLHQGALKQHRRGRPLRTQSSSMPRGCGPYAGKHLPLVLAQRLRLLCRHRRCTLPAQAQRAKQVRTEHTARALPSRKRPFVPAELGE